MAIFKGSGVAIITPMKEDYSVNYDKLEELVNFNIDNGTDAIIIVGTTGECSTLSEEEHIKCIKKTVEFTKGRIPVVAGTGSNSTATAKRLTIEAEAAGADAALIVSPYYNKATQKGLKLHYGELAESTKLPIIIYNIPGRTGVNVLPETIAELIKTHKNIVGVKEATGDFMQMARTLYLTDGNCEFYSGEDGMIIPLLSMGGMGVISVMANIIPQDTHDLCYAFFNGETEKATKMQYKVTELVDSLFCEVNPIPIKTAMNMLGMDVGPLRLPLCDMTDANKARLRKAMTDYGLMLKD